MYSHYNIKPGGIAKVGGAIQVHSPHGVLNLTEFHRPHQGLRQVFKKTCTLMVYDCHHSDPGPCLGAGIRLTDLQLLGLWVVMNIINSIATGGSPCVLVSLT